jgi:hypothetical protein
MREGKEQIKGEGLQQLCQVERRRDEAGWGEGEHTPLSVRRQPGGPVSLLLKNSDAFAQLAHSIDKKIQVLCH